MDELLVEAALVRLVRRSLSLVIKLFLPPSAPPHKIALRNTFSASLRVQAAVRCCLLITIAGGYAPWGTWNVGHSSILQPVNKEAERFEHQSCTRTGTVNHS